MKYTALMNPFYAFTYLISHFLFASYCSNKVGCFCAQIGKSSVHRMVSLCLILLCCLYSNSASMVWALAPSTELNQSTHAIDYDDEKSDVDEEIEGLIFTMGLEPSEAVQKYAGEINAILQAYNGFFSKLFAVFDYDSVIQDKIWQQIKGIQLRLQHAILQKNLVHLDLIARADLTCAHVIYVRKILELNHQDWTSYSLDVLFESLQSIASNYQRQVSQIMQQEDQRRSAETSSLSLLHFLSGRGSFFTETRRLSPDSHLLSSDYDDAHSDLGGNPDHSRNLTLKCLKNLENDLTKTLNTSEDLKAAYRLFIDKVAELTRPILTTDDIHTLETQMFRFLDFLPHVLTPQERYDLLTHIQSVSKTLDSVSNLDDLISVLQQIDQVQNECNRHMFDHSRFADNGFYTLDKAKGFGSFDMTLGAMVGRLFLLHQLDASSSSQTLPASWGHIMTRSDVISPIKANVLNSMTGFLENFPQSSLKSESSWQENFLEELKRNLPQFNTLFQGPLTRFLLQNTKDQTQEQEQAVQNEWRAKVEIQIQNNIYEAYERFHRSYSGPNKTSLPQPVDFLRALQEHLQRYFLLLSRPWITRYKCFIGSLLEHSVMQKLIALTIDTQACGLAKSFKDALQRHGIETLPEIDERITAVFKLRIQSAMIDFRDRGLLSADTVMLSVYDMQRLSLVMALEPLFEFGEFHESDLIKNVKDFIRSSSCKLMPELAQSDLSYELQRLQPVLQELVKHKQDCAHLLDAHSGDFDDPRPFKDVLANHVAEAFARDWLHKGHIDVQNTSIRAMRHFEELAKTDPWSLIAASFELPMAESVLPNTSWLEFCIKVIERRSLQDSWTAVDRSDPQDTESIRISLGHWFLEQVAARYPDVYEFYPQLLQEYGVTQSDLELSLESVSFQNQEAAESFFLKWALKFAASFQSRDTGLSLEQFVQNVSGMRMGSLPLERFKPTTTDITGAHSAAIIKQLAENVSRLPLHARYPFSPVLSEAAMQEQLQWRLSQKSLAWIVQQQELLFFFLGIMANNRDGSDQALIKIPQIFASLYGTHWEIDNSELMQSQTLQALQLMDRLAHQYSTLISQIEALQILIPHAFIDSESGEIFSVRSFLWQHASAWVTSQAHEAASKISLDAVLTQGNLIAALPQTIRPYWTFRPEIEQWSIVSNEELLKQLRESVEHWPQESPVEKAQNRQAGHLLKSLRLSQLRSLLRRTPQTASPDHEGPFLSQGFLDQLVDQKQREIAQRYWKLSESKSLLGYPQGALRSPASKLTSLIPDVQKVRRSYSQSEQQAVQYLCFVQGLQNIWQLCQQGELNWLTLSQQKPVVWEQFKTQMLRLQASEVQKGFQSWLKSLRFQSALNPRKQAEMESLIIACQHNLLCFIAAFQQDSNSTLEEKVSGEFINWMTGMKKLLPFLLGYQDQEITEAQVLWLLSSVLNTAEDYQINHCFQWLSTLCQHSSQDQMHLLKALQHISQQVVQMTCQGKWGQLQWLNRQLHNGFRDVSSTQIDRTMVVQSLRQLLLTWKDLSETAVQLGLLAEDAIEDQALAELARQMNTTLSLFRQA